MLNQWWLLFYFFENEGSGIVIQEFPTKNESESSFPNKTQKASLCYFPFLGPEEGLPLQTCMCVLHECMWLCLSSHAVPPDSRQRRCGRGGSVAEKGEAVVINQAWAEERDWIIWTCFLIFVPSTATKYRGLGSLGQLWYVRCSPCWEDGTVSGLLSVFRRLICLWNWFHLQT